MIETPVAYFKTWNLGDVGSQAHPYRLPATQDADRR
jgi:hypothetical protein